jgi:hypothetical protein
MKYAFVVLVVLGLFSVSCASASQQTPSANPALAAKTVVTLVSPPPVSTTQVPASSSTTASVILDTSSAAAAQPADNQSPADTGSNVEAASRDSLSLQIVSLSTPVSPGGSVTLVAHTTAGAACVINVYYKSVRSAAEGLNNKTAEASGSISWMWKVGNDMAPGTYRIEINASLGEKKASQTTYLVVS